MFLPIPFVTNDELSQRTCRRSQRNRLQHVRRTSHAAIHKQLEPLIWERHPSLLLELLDDFAQDFDARARKIELPPAVVGEDDASEVGVVGFEGILVVGSVCGR